jgi:hypothetical protein
MISSLTLLAIPDMWRVTGDWTAEQPDVGAEVEPA